MVAAPEPERQVVLHEFVSRGFPEAEARASVQIESGWDPSAHNAIRAGGLIGFLPSVLRLLGWTQGPERFWQLSASEQAPWIGKYLDMVGRKWSHPGDTYLALAASGHVGDSDERIIYPRGSKAWQQNPGWRPRNGGDITAGSIRATLFRAMERGQRPGPARATPRVNVGGWLLLAFGVWFLTRKSSRARAWARTG